MEQTQIDQLRSFLARQLDRENYEALRDQARETGRDLHKLVVVWAIGVLYEEVTPEQRALAKNFCFGHTYGMTGRKMT